MAEKTIKTRIALKAKTLNEWNEAANADYVPLRGEICLCEIPSGSEAATNPPTVLFKVGDGEKPFKNLNWASALAADVYEWAKGKNKPTYTAAEVGLGSVKNAGMDAEVTADSENYISSGAVKTYVDGAISDIPTVSDTNTQYQLVSEKGAETGEITLKLQKKDKEETEWSDVVNAAFAFKTGTVDGTISIAGTDISVKGFKEYQDKVDNIETAIKSGITFKGDVEDFPENPQNGWLVIKGTKEYIYSEDSGEWIELGDEGTHLTKETADTYYVGKGQVITTIDTDAPSNTEIPSESAVINYVDDYVEDNVFILNCNY